MKELSKGNRTGELQENPEAGEGLGAGPEAVTFVYFAGYGLQFEDDNYFVPIDASLSRDGPMGFSSASTAVTSG
jgi:hypothetical protein